MNNKKLEDILFFFPFIVQFILTLSSSEIWEKSQEYLEYYGLNLNKTHFIYDEKNYTGYLPTDNKMIQLYEKQESIYNSYDAANYIFLVEDIDETKESIDEVVEYLEDMISSNYSIDIEKSIICFFTNNEHYVKIKVGENISKNLTIEKIEKLLSDIKSDLNNNNYYNMCKVLLEKIDYYYTYKLKSNKIIWIIIIVVFLVFIIIFGLLKCSKDKKVKRDKNLMKIAGFLKKLKSNEKILLEYCVLCLEKLKSKSKKNSENTDNTENPDNIENPLYLNEITALHCGHEFHSSCINEWMNKKTECPICSYKDSEDEEDYDKIVLNIQLDFNKDFSDSNKIYSERLYSKEYETLGNESFSEIGGGDNTFYHEETSD